MEKHGTIGLEFLKLYIYNVGDFLTIIPYIIMKMRTKSNKTNNKKDDGINYLHFKLEDNYGKCNLFRNLLIFTIADFIAQISGVIYFIIITKNKIIINTANLNTAMIFSIFATIIFSILFLHTKLYSHHKLSIVINLICLIILDVIDIQKINDMKDHQILLQIIYLLVKIFTGILYSFENVIGKIILLYNYKTTFSLLLNKAVFHFFYLIIFSLPFIFIELYDDVGEPKNVFFMIAAFFKDKLFIFIFIVYILSSFFYSNLIFKIIDAFSPNHFAISRILENIGIFVIDSIINGPEALASLFIRIIIFTFLLLSSFIFNEYLIINIGNLSKNTQLFLLIEANREKEERGYTEVSEELFEISTNIEIPNIDNINN